MKSFVESSSFQIKANLIFGTQLQHLALATYSLPLYFIMPDTEATDLLYTSTLNLIYKPGFFFFATPPLGVVRLEQTCATDSRS